MHKNIKLQMFPIATFIIIIQAKRYLTELIKNKNLPFVKTEKRNVLNVQIKKAERNLSMKNKSYL